LKEGKGFENKVLPRSKGERNWRKRNLLLASYFSEHKGLEVLGAEGSRVVHAVCQGPGRTLRVRGGGEGLNKHFTGVVLVVWGGGGGGEECSSEEWIGGSREG